MMTDIEVVRADWPVLLRGEWGFLVTDRPRQEPRFMTRDQAVTEALTHLTPQYRHIYQWRDVFLEAMAQGDLLPDVEHYAQGVVPVWRLVGLGSYLEDWLSLDPAPTETERLYLARFLNDWADTFVRQHAPDLESRRAIGGPLGRRLVARLIRPREVWDVNPSDRRTLTAAILEWERTASEVAVPLTAEGPVIRLSGKTGGPLLVQAVDLSGRDLGEWGLRFPLWHRLLESGMDAAVSVEEGEADAFWQKELPQLIRLGVRVQLPSDWKNPGIRARGRVQQALDREHRPSFFGLDQIVQVDWEVLLDGQPMTVKELETLVRASTPLVRIRGRYVVVDEETLAEAKRVYERARRSRVKMADALRWTVAGTANGIEVVSSGQVLNMLAQLRGPYPAFRRLKTFTGDLRPYQTEGVQWLVRRMKASVGALLADDMGLGKTVEVIAALSRLREEALLEGPVLIVAPLSVVGNWEREFSRFDPSVRVGSHLGTGRLQGGELTAWADSVDAVLTTYDVLLRDVDSLKKVIWAGIVADEAQQLKNPGTKRARAIRQIPAHWRIALTGTPVENRLHDLWAEMEFLNPGYLGNEREFRLRFERAGEQAMGDLRRLLSPFVLRRMKTDPTVMPDLPEKVEIREWTHLTPEQIALYQAVVDTLFQDVSGTLTRMARRGAIVAALTHLKQIVNHPALYLHQNAPIKGRSAKLERLEDLLADILEAHERVVVFTQYVAWVHLLAPYVRRRFHVGVLSFHGSLAKAERDQVLAHFTDPEGPPVLLASLKAGGVGLNLASAQHVIHYDRWWNPATEDQATDRVWRMGQTHLVTVHKFVTRGTVEERIDALIQDKRQLSDRLLSDEAATEWISELSNRELHELVTLRETLWTD